MDGFLRVTQLFLGLAFDLVLQAFDLLFLVTDQLAGFFLDLAADVLQFAIDLVLVHGALLSLTVTP